MKIISGCAGSVWKVVNGNIIGTLDAVTVGATVDGDEIIEETEIIVDAEEAKLISGWAADINNNNRKRSIIIIINKIVIRLQRKKFKKFPKIKTKRKTKIWNKCKIGHFSSKYIFKLNLWLNIIICKLY